MFFDKSKSSTCDNVLNLNHVRKSNLFERFFLPENGFIVFLVAIGIIYGVVPIIVAIVTSEANSFGLLSIITLVSILAMWVGNRISIIDGRFYSTSKRLRVSSSGFIGGVWFFFSDVYCCWWWCW